MVGPRRFLTKSALLAGLTAVVVGLGSCSPVEDEPEETVHVATGTMCDVDPGSAEAQTINERVGGLQTDDFSVRLSQTTRAGNVVLVVGDVTAAFDVLTKDYGVAVVAQVEDEDEDGDRAAEFAQVRQLVLDICGPAD